MSKQRKPHGATSAEWNCRDHVMQYVVAPGSTRQAVVQQYKDGLFALYIQALGQFYNNFDKCASYWTL